ncbi:MAG: RNA polymerase subunit sigma-24 [Robiginitomaculum sp.]|nr:MAG: RNA polymerase subunit sigma-24 [Robiginitomaculum sp.]
MTPPSKYDLESEDGRELIKRAIGHEDRAFTILMRRFKLPLYRFALRHVGDPDDAEDVVQETFVAAHRNLAKYNPKFEASTWLYQITLNKCRDLGRKRKTRNFLLRMTPFLEEKVSQFSLPEDPESQLLAKREIQILEQQIAELPRALREPLVLCAIEDLSHKQAAKILGISSKAVEMRVYRARKKLERFQVSHDQT